MDSGAGQAGVERIQAMVNAGPVQFPGLFTGEFWNRIDSNAETDKSSEGDYDTRNADDDKPKDAGADDDQPKDVQPEDNQPGPEVPKEDSNEKDLLRSDSSSSDGTQSPKIAKVKPDMLSVPDKARADHDSKEKEETLSKGKRVAETSALSKTKKKKKLRKAVVTVLLKEAS